MRRTNIPTTLARAWILALACAFVLLFGGAARANAAQPQRATAVRAPSIHAAHHVKTLDDDDDDDQAVPRHPCVHARHRHGRLFAWQPAVPTARPRMVAERKAAPRAEAHVARHVLPRAHDARGPPPA